MKITVAALMTTPWIARFLEVPAGHRPGPDPRALRGRPAVVAGASSACRRRRVPRISAKSPVTSAGPRRRRDYGAYDIEILAEINNAPRLRPTQFRAAADYFRASGADVIDIGCTPGLPFPALGDVVRELREAGMRVSIDSFEPRNPRRGGGGRGAGAEREPVQSGGGREPGAAARSEWW